MLILIFAPPALHLATNFDAGNYYSLIGGIIGGIITLLVLLWQFTYENEKKREENKITARGIFEVNYLAKLDDKLQKCVVKGVRERLPNTNKDNNLIITLHGQKSVLDCYVIINMHHENDKRFDDSITAPIGLIVPDQTVVIPMASKRDNIDITILYRTLMSEMIKHKFVFNKGIVEPAKNERMYYKNSVKSITQDDLPDLISSTDGFNEIFASESQLFEYNK